MLARPYTVVTYEFAAGAAQCAIVCACTSRGVGAEQTVYTALFTVESVGGWLRRLQWEVRTCMDRPSARSVQRGRLLTPRGAG